MSSVDPTFDPSKFYGDGRGYSQHPHYELPGSPKEEASTDKGGGFSTTVELMVPWAYRNAVAADIVGSAQLYPRLPDCGARAVSVSIAPFEARTDAETDAKPSVGMASYEFAKLTIKYKLQAETADFVSESLEPSADMITMDPTQFTTGTKLHDAIQAAYTGATEYYKTASSWTSWNTPTEIDAYCKTRALADMPKFVIGDRGSECIWIAPPIAMQAGGKVYDIGAYPEMLKETDQGPSRIQRKMDYTITFYRVITLPNQLLDMVDCVNNKAIPSKLLGLTFAPETLLFNPPSCKRRWNYTSFPYWEMTYKFTYNPAGWNRFWNPKYTKFAGQIQPNASWDENISKQSVSTPPRYGQITLGGIVPPDEDNPDPFGAVEKQVLNYLRMDDTVITNFRWTNEGKVVAYWKQTLDPPTPSAPNPLMPISSWAENPYQNDHAGNYDYYYIRTRDRDEGGRYLYKKYRPFAPADFSPLFQLDRNLSPWQDPRITGGS